VPIDDLSTANDRVWSAAKITADLANKRDAETPCCHLEKTADQLLANDTLTSLSWDNVVADTDNFFDSGSPYKITFPAKFAGRSAILTGLIRWDNNTTGARMAYFIHKTSAGVTKASFIGIQDNPAAGKKYNRGYNGVTAMIQNIEAGDYIEFIALQTSGGNLNATGSEYTQIKMNIL
jgi:hypothetical protein